MSVYLPSLQVQPDDLLRLMADCLQAGCWSVNMHTKEAWLADESLQMLGLSNMPGTIHINTLLHQVVHADDREAMQALIRTGYQQKGEVRQAEIRLQTSSGRYSRYLLYARALPPYSITGCMVKVASNSTNMTNNTITEEDKDRLIEVAEDMTDVGVWEYHFDTGRQLWSRKVYAILGLQAGNEKTWDEVMDYFEPADKETLREAVEMLAVDKQPFDLELKLLTAFGRVRWLRVVGKPWLDDAGAVCGMHGILQSIQLQKSKEQVLIENNIKIAARNFFFDETSKMARVGGWEINLTNNTVNWSEQTKRIFEVYNDYKPAPDKAIHFFYGESKKIIAEKYFRLINTGEAFDVELEFITARKRNKWVRTLGKAVLDENGKVVAVRGVIKDIDVHKKRELALQQSLDIIHRHNEKLKDFAHIVSHNLRSHTGNLKMITNMIDLETEPEAKLEWVEHIKGLSDSLDETVNNLRDIVNAHLNMHESKKQISFAEVYANIESVLTVKTNNEKAVFDVDFSKCPHVEYVPAYLESIVLNLLTNAIKYKHPERQPVVHIKTFMADNRACLQVADNGMGIDLQAYGDRLFKMNETFHNNPDARGIGLYITKNQIEKLGGTIDVQSEVGKGTTFTIKF